MLHSFLGFFWLIRTIKNTFFFLYLWQLKEYHIGRFISHFDTEKGRKIISNPLALLKIVFIFFVQAVFLPQILLVIYIIESAQAIKNFFQKKLKVPVLTKKIIFLASVSIILEVSYFISIYYLPAGIVIFQSFI